MSPQAQRRRVADVFANSVSATVTPRALPATKSALPSSRARTRRREAAVLGAVAHLDRRPRWRSAVRRPTGSGPGDRGAASRGGLERDAGRAAAPRARASRARYATSGAGRSRRNPSSRSARRTPLPRVCGLPTELALGVALVEQRSRPTTMRRASVPVLAPRRAVLLGVRAPAPRRSPAPRSAAPPRGARAAAPRLAQRSSLARVPLRRHPARDPARLQLVAEAEHDGPREPNVAPERERAERNRKCVHRRLRTSWIRASWRVVMPTEFTSSCRARRRRTSP